MSAVRNLGPACADEQAKGRGFAEIGSLLAIARESVTVIQDGWDHPILSPEDDVGGGAFRACGARGADRDDRSNVDVLVISPDIKSLTMVEDTGSHGSPLAKAVRMFVPGASEITVSQSPSDREIADAATGAARRDLVIVGTHNGHLYPAQAELVKRVVQAGSPVVVVGMRNPYDVRDFAQVSTYIAAYSYRECSMQAAAEVIFGFTVPSGQLPVTIPGCK